MRHNHVNQSHVRWYSPHLDRDMQMLVFGHAGARVLVFPTSMGSFMQYRDMGMVQALERHLREGWIQLFCVDSHDAESWYAEHLAPPERLRHHTSFERYILEEVLPYSRHVNPNPYLIATGCSFGAFHAMLLGLRHPRTVSRVVGLSGAYDASWWLDGHQGLDGYFMNPLAFVAGVQSDAQRQELAGVDIIFAVGREDRSYGTNVGLSEALWRQGIWHAFRPWDGWAHDWPFWREMILHYIGGPDSR